MLLGGYSSGWGVEIKMDDGKGKECVEREESGRGKYNRIDSFINAIF